MPTTYDYPPLTGNKPFRLLYLLGRKESPILKCRLVQVSIDNHPPYEALSYEWKKYEGLTEIACESFMIEISANLASALEHLRFSVRERILWADAVCINQSDIIEKGRQVPMMRDIYANAKCVVVWLSSSSVFISEALAILLLLAYIWIERLQKGLDPENPLPFTLYQRPKDSVFLSKDDKHWFSFEEGYERKYITLSRPYDETALKLDDKKLWIAVDDLFGDTYFQRTWILQEVAVPNAVYIRYGQNRIPFDIFSAAYGGRNLLAFMPFSFSRPGYSEIPFSCVRDCRKRYRNIAFGFDLAAVLATLNYTKETMSHDHIYAPMALVRDPGVYEHIIPDYEKTLESVFIEAATYIINDRLDLYFWGTKTLYNKRKMKNLPSWVPEWTGENCEEAVEHYRKYSRENHFSNLLQGNYLIQGCSLYVNAYISEKIDFTAPLRTDEEILSLVAALESHLNKYDTGLFDQYRASMLDKMDTPAVALRQTQDQQLGKMIDTFWILLTFKCVPDILLYVLSQLYKPGCHFIEHGSLNINALWAILTSRSPYLPPTQSTLPGERLFLATLFLWSIRLARPEGWSLPGGTLKTYEIWVMAAAILDGIGSASLGDLYTRHSMRLNLKETDLFFATKDGYFGTAPLQDLTESGEYYVAILGGAYIPYILKKCGGYYTLFSHAYVEAVMEWKILPRHLPTLQIELR